MEKLCDIFCSWDQTTFGRTTLGTIVWVFMAVFLIPVLLLYGMWQHVMSHELANDPWAGNAMFGYMLLILVVGFVHSFLHVLDGIAWVVALATQ